MSANPLLGLFATWVGWAAGFLLLYAVQATGCRMGWNEQMIGSISTLRLVLIATTAAIVLVLIGLSWRTSRNAGVLSLARIGALANGAAILATLCFTGALWLSMCA
ncbi:MAG TPA: hypothetical protein VGN93_09675 [Shinella sp.]|jgi:hypothetical protein|uniref:hypothetical protein n=1 Tax=Shinella sp. TaxID=1870904 RepID=UPI002E147A0B|nr:hypothetical protein [Shinella sp.]